MQEPEYLSQVIDFAGFYKNILGNLHGIDTVVYELIQNADDVKDDEGNPLTTLIRFDVRDDALVVYNDGVFRDEDFRRMQHIASGAKSLEADTTGAFGIGFVSVYQLTDHPEILSKNQHWVMYPEAEAQKRIQRTFTDTQATTFILPWATDPQSKVRRLLELEPVDVTQLDEYLLQINKAIYKAAPFLKQLTQIELLRNGVLHHRIEREMVDDAILIADEHNEISWLLLTGEFEREAAALKGRYPSIKEFKKHHVHIAIPEDGLTTGCLYAILPTEDQLELPFHINADFFPSIDRKGIMLRSNPQSEWNRTAIRAAAETLADNLTALYPENDDRHIKIWDMLESLHRVYQHDDIDNYEGVFRFFWEKVKPRIPETPIVYTADGRWVLPAAARFPQTEEERVVSDILVELGISLIHPDLYSHYNLLASAAGTPLLTITDIVDAIKSKGLVDDMQLSKAPGTLKKPETWSKLWTAIEKIASRQSRNLTLSSEPLNQLRETPIVWDIEMRLWCPSHIRKGDINTRQVFSEIGWLHPEIGQKVPFISQLVKDFTVTDALALLGSYSSEENLNDWRDGSLDIKALYQWFTKHKSQITDDEDHIASLHSLSIWPVGNTLSTLDNVYIPGNFDDPLNVSNLVRIDLLGGDKSLLEELGIPELTFKRYVDEKVPDVVENGGLPVDQLRKLIRLLAQRIGDLNDIHLTLKLKNLPLVECTDGQFYVGSQVYFPSDEIVLLKGRVPIAVHMTEDHYSLRDLLSKLGVVDKPRMRDIVDLVRDITVSPPNKKRAEDITAVFEHLTARWPLLSESEKRETAPLKGMAWLPSDTAVDRWFKPIEIYAIFQRYLFDSQARFLCFKATVQRQASTIGLIDYLNIGTTPTPDLVVSHLLHCSHLGEEVNKQIYTYLSQNLDEPALRRLKDTPCLLLPDGAYVYPHQVFSHGHPFGKYRYQLGSAFWDYRDLLDYLNVRENPETSDYFDVMLEISSKYGHKTLPEEDMSILMACWTSLSNLVNQEKAFKGDFIRLSKSEVVPNGNGILTRPDYIFFNDRPNLIEKLGLGPSVIDRPVGAWRAMEAAGVQFLSQAVEAEIVDALDIRLVPKLKTYFHSRMHLLKRVLQCSCEASRENLEHKSEDLHARLENIELGEVLMLRVMFIVRIGLNNKKSNPELAEALWLDDKNVIVIKYTEDEQIPWAAVSRELASAVKRTGELGNLASGFQQVLSARTTEEAERTLDALGYASFDFRKEESQVENTVIEGFGGDDAPAEDFEPTTSIWSDEPDISRQPVSGSLDEGVTDIDDEDVDTEPTPETVTEPSEDVSQPEIDNPDDSDAILPPEHPQTDGPQEGKDGAPLERSKKPQGSDRTPPPQKRTEIRRITSYVYTKDQDAEPKDSEKSTHKYDVERTAVDFALRYEELNGRIPKEQEHLNPGFDILSTDKYDNVYYIEVKGLSGTWETPNPAQLTRMEFEKAREYGENYWLYIVENATSTEPQLHIIQDPANKADRYLIDHGWMGVEEQTKESIIKRIYIEMEPPIEDENFDEQEDYEEEKGDSPILELTV